MISQELIDLLDDAMREIESEDKNVMIIQDQRTGRACVLITDKEIADSVIAGFTSSDHTDEHGTTWKGVRGPWLDA